MFLGIPFFVWMIGAYAFGVISGAVFIIFVGIAMTGAAADRNAQTGMEESQF